MNERRLVIIDQELIGAEPNPSSISRNAVDAASQVIYACHGDRPRY
jgi:hypothetical protein